MLQTLLDWFGDAATSTVVRTVVALLAIPGAIVGIWTFRKWLTGNDVHSQIDRVDEKISKLSINPLRSEDAKVISGALFAIDRFLRLEMIPMISTTKHLEPQRDFHPLLREIQKLQAVKTALTSTQVGLLEKLIGNLEKQLNVVIGALREASAMMAGEARLDQTEIVERIQLQAKIDTAIATYEKDAAALRSSLYG